jgi:ATP-binding cassette subfamily B protein
LVEKEITQTIQHIWGKDSEMMIVLVAHRLSTIMHADRIYVMQKWKIIESWNHKDLIANNWLYNAMRREQIWE